MRVHPRFVRARSAPWTPDDWDDGYVDNRGRFRVYRPDYPRAYALGYALRAHVVWWLAHGEVHPQGTNLHHRNENRTDDRIENLEVLSHGEHTRRHSIGPPMILTCHRCHNRFTREIWRLKSRAREGSRKTYCSPACCYASRGAKAKEEACHAS